MPATGRFGHVWAELASALGADERVIDFGKPAGWDQGPIAEALTRDRNRRIRAVLAVHTDTSAAIRNAPCLARHP